MQYLKFKNLIVKLSLIQQLFNNLLLLVTIHYPYTHIMSA